MLQRSFRFLSFSDRTFGTWTALASVIRFYSALNIHDLTAYRLAFVTYLFVMFHFYSEWLVFKTCTFGKETIVSLLLSPAMSLYMWYGQNFYVAIP